MHILMGHCLLHPGLEGRKEPRKERGAAQEEKPGFRWAGTYPVEEDLPGHPGGCSQTHCGLLSPGAEGAGYEAFNAHLSGDI